MHSRFCRRLQRWWPPRHCEERSDEAIQGYTWSPGLLRGACHRAGVRPTRWLAMTKNLNLPLDHLQLELGDRLGGIETLRAGLGAVHDGVAAIESERVFEIVEPFAGGFVAA